MSSSSPHLYPSPGRCIYCGDEDVDLFDEHIIAFALGGKHIIEAASCASCAVYTCRAEGICLGQMFKAARTRFKLASRRRRPDTLPVAYVEGNKRWVVHVPVAEHPTLLLIAADPPPRMLRDWFPPQVFEGYRVWVHGDGVNLGKAAASTPKSQSIEIGTFNHVAFARMLAKTAHAFAVARWGLDGFAPLLTDLIREKTEDYADLVGGDPGQSPYHPSAYRMQLNRRTIGGTEHGIVAIQLFARLGAPVFYVIVGSTKSTQDQLAP